VLLIDLVSSCWESFQELSRAGGIVLGGGFCQISGHKSICSGGGKFVLKSQDFIFALRIREVRGNSEEVKQL